MSTTISDTLQLTGAAIILLAFWANASGRWGRASLPYLWLNLIGSFFLGAVAIAARQPGFILLEVVWAIISLLGLLHGKKVQPTGQ
jgi:hypothetical protein